MAIVLLQTSEINETFSIMQSLEHSSVIQSEEKGEKLNCAYTQGDI